MSRLGDIENSIVARLESATVSGEPAFATVRGFSGGYRAALSSAIRRERLPAAYVTFVDESTAPETPDARRGPRFTIIVAAEMLRAGQNARLGDDDAHGAFLLMDVVRSRLDFHEPAGDVILLPLLGRFLETDDRVALYEVAYRAWPIFVQLGSPDPLIAGPRMIGSVTDYIRFDPAHAEYTFAGAARPMRRLTFHGVVALGQYNVGTMTATQLATNADTASAFYAAQVTNANDGGWRSLPVMIDDACDVSEPVDVIVPVQAAAAASGDLSLRVDWDIARDTAAGIIEGNAGNVVVGPTGAGDLANVVAGTIPAETFQPGDVVSFAVRRMASTDASDTYTQDILLARSGWLNFQRNRL